MAGKKKASKKKNTSGVMTMTEHLKELRKVIVSIVAAFVVVMLIGYYFAPDFVKMCLDLAEGYAFVQTGPAELLGQYVLMAVILGIVAAVPVAIWQIYRFASPGLKKNESRAFLSVMLAGVLFFFVGAVFCILVVLPFTLQFFLSLNTIEIQGMYSVKEYMAYMYGVIVAFGIIFEIPVIASLLALTGLLKPETMVSGRRLVIVVNFIIGAAITPTDVVSQLLVAIPMCLLYEISIVFVRIIAKARALRAPERVEQAEARKEEIRAERKLRWERAAAEVEQQEEK